MSLLNDCSWLLYHWNFTVEIMWGHIILYSVINFYQKVLCHEFLMFSNKIVCSFFNRSKMLFWDSKFALIKTLQNLLFSRFALLKSRNHSNRVNLALALISDIKVYLYTKARRICTKFERLWHGRAKFVVKYFAGLWHDRAFFVPTFFARTFARTFAQRKHEESTEKSRLLHDVCTTFARL